MENEEPVVEASVEEPVVEGVNADQATIEAAVKALQGEEPAPVAPTEAPKAEEPKVEVKPDPPVSPVWAAVKKAEQEARRMRDTAKRELAEAKKLREQLQNSGKTQADILADIKKDPRNIEKYGISLQEVIDRVLTEGKPTEGTAKREVNEELTAVKRELAEMKQFIQRQQAQTAEEKFKERFSSTLQGEEFELLRSHPDAWSECVAFAAEYYQAHGKMDLTPAQIAGHLQDTWREHLTSLRSAKAVRKVFGLPDEEAPEGADESEPEPKVPPRKTSGPAAPKTVTSTMSSSPTRGAPPAKVNRTNDDDIVREAAKLVPKDAWDSMG